jgi:hypothetical protein
MCLVRGGRNRVRCAHETKRCRNTVCIVWLRQRENGQSIGSSDRHILLPFPPLIGHRNCRGSAVDLSCPKLFAGFLVKCPEARVSSCSHETRPPAVVIRPPLPVAPVLRFPSGRVGVARKGSARICHLCSLTAISRAHGGFWHAQFPIVMPSCSQPRSD